MSVILISVWWLTYPSAKSWSSSVGMMTFPTVSGKSSNSMVPNHQPDIVYPVYPLVNSHLTMENFPFNGKTHYKWAIFNSYFDIIRGYPYICWLNSHNFPNGENSPRISQPHVLDPHRVHLPEIHQSCHHPGRPHQWSCCGTWEFGSGVGVQHLNI